MAIVLVLWVLVLFSGIALQIGGSARAELLVARNIAASGFMQKADEQMRPKALSELERAINRKITERGL